MAQNRGHLIEASRIFIDYLFACYEFEKFYAECPEFNLNAFRSGMGSAFVEEGVLRQHERYLGKWWDLHYFALYKDTWLSRVEQVESHVSALLSSSSDDKRRLDIDEFCSIIRVAMEIDEDPITGKMRLVDDLGFDSVQMYEAFSLVEELGVLIDDNSLGQIRTVEDLHFHYLQGYRAPEKRESE
jgi:acyl carrier protein